MLKQQRELIKKQRKCRWWFNALLCNWLTARGWHLFAHISLSCQFILCSACVCWQVSAGWSTSFGSDLNLNSFWMDSFEIFIEKFTITGGSITAVVIPLLFPLYHWMSHLSREAQYLHLQNELACIFVQMFICLRGSILITLVIPLFWESFSNDTFLALVLHLKVPCYFPIFHLLLATLSDRRMKTIMCITFSLFSLKSPIKNSIFLFDYRYQNYVFVPP